MLHCWAKEPNKRPGFKELANTLSDVSTDKPALSKTSLIPLDHFAIPDSDSKENIKTNGAAINREAESSQEDIVIDRISASEQPDDTRL